MRRKSSIFLRKFRRIERRVLVAWIRFARRHRHSHRLPFMLFGVLFLDGFAMVIPSIILVIAAITISPARWLLFCLILPIAQTLNNIVTYFLGYWLGAEAIWSFVQYLHLDHLWNSAEKALHDYGSYATFMGGLFGLPTQIMTMLIGISDAHFQQQNPAEGTQLISAIAFVFLGHLTKSLVICSLTRYGWIKLERKFAPKPRHHHHESHHHSSH